jgi:amino acid transporter
MTTTSYPVGGTTPADVPVDKGLKGGALGLIASTVMGVASTAPAYSLAATLGFIILVPGMGYSAPAIVLLAFVPMLFTAIGYDQLNKADPDCGTTFTWGTRAFGTYTGWLGGWGIIGADILVMASLAQIAGQYVFLRVGANGIGADATSGWVLLVGMIWLALMTWICYRGIEVSAMLQKFLLTLEVAMLAVFSVVALVKVGTGHAPLGSVDPALSWFNPFHLTHTALTQGLLLMIFIYWGWDTAVSINEETTDKSKTPGRAAVISTVLLLITYALVTTAAQSFAGIGSKGIGLSNTNHEGDVISILGHAVFGGSGLGTTLSKLLILMVLSSAAASTQTTILPTARTSLAMAAYKALPDSFAHMHRRYLTPTVSTLVMGGISGVLYLVMNFTSGGNTISDSVTACGIMIAFYYGLTGFACTWFYRRVLTRSLSDFVLKGFLPTLGGLILFVFMIIAADYDFYPINDYTSFGKVGGVFILGIGTMIIGVIVMIIFRLARPAFFQGRTLAAWQVVNEQGEMVSSSSGGSSDIPTGG